MSTKSLQALVENVEKELLDEIIKNLEQNTLSEEEAQEIAQEFLALLPIEDKQDLLKKLHELSVDHIQTQPVYLQYAKPFEEEEREKKLKQISHHIKKGQIEHALAVAKGEQS